MQSALPPRPAVKEPAEYESKHETLVHALQHNEKHSPNHTLIEWVNSKCAVESSITYKCLCHQSGLVASLLLQNDVKRGDRVMIAYPFGLEFLGGLFGCMRIGVIPCPVYPPNILDKAKARALMVAALSSNKTPGIKWLATDKLKTSQADKKLEDAHVSPDDVAFIQ